MKPIILIFLFLSLATFGEGTKEIWPIKADSAYFSLNALSNGSPFGRYNSSADYRIYVHIKNHATEEILFGFGDILHQVEYLPPTDTVKWYLFNPSGTLKSSGYMPKSGEWGYIATWEQAQAGPQTPSAMGGYSPLWYWPEVDGDWYISFKWTGVPHNFRYFDVSVMDCSNTNFSMIPGRLFCKAWQLFTMGYAPDSTELYYPMHGKFFIYSSDSIVTKFDPNGFDGRFFSITANHLGCTNYEPFELSRKSRSFRFQYPEYKVFLNNPDSTVYPSGMIGEIDTIYPIAQLCNGQVNIGFHSTKAGTAEILFLLSPLGLVDRVMTQAITAGDNIIIWDGRDGNGNPVPGGSTFTISISYIAGLTNLPIFDVENNVGGFICSLVRPSLALPQPKFYWDDRDLAGGGCPSNYNLTGCTPTPAGCHTWELNHNCHFHDQTINTWWYTVKTTEAPITITTVEGVYTTLYH